MVENEPGPCVQSLPAQGDGRPGRPGPVRGLGPWHPLGVRAAGPLDGCFTRESSRWCCACRSSPGYASFPGVPDGRASCRGWRSRRASRAPRRACSTTPRWSRRPSSRSRPSCSRSSSRRSSTRSSRSRSTACTSRWLGHLRWPWLLLAVPALSLQILLTFGLGCIAATLTAFPARHDARGRHRPDGRVLRDADRLSRFARAGAAAAVHRGQPGDAPGRPLSARVHAARGAATRRRSAYLAAFCVLAAAARGPAVRPRAATFRGPDLTEMPNKTAADAGFPLVPRSRWWNPFARRFREDGFPCCFCSPRRRARRRPEQARRRPLRRSPRARPRRRRPGSGRGSIRP